ncbi:MAG: alpha-isopropylmalate synthase regulatory domain-containing protein [Flavobacteriaceae bacterium]|tara:strand:+ start:12553 stop:14091 length:1539 start_codon:yes stop_codon:yes gene_type:complete
MNALTNNYIEIMDTTLRDGEQSSGVSFSATEKLTISKLLISELSVDRIEIASARVSDGEFNSVKKICNWARENENLEKIEVLTFLDDGLSLDWINKSGCKVQNLLTKGSLNHLKNQLNQKPYEHFEKIEKILDKADKNKILTNVYLEDWSNGMKKSKEYILSLLDFLSKTSVKRVMLPDTLGILTPKTTADFVNEITSKYSKIHFDFHGHNDYDLGVSNTLEAVKNGIKGIHLTVNGIGERAGNVALESTVAAINDFIPNIRININEDSLYKVSQLVSTFTGHRIPPNKPIVGSNVFTQTAGIHADGDNKNNLYFNDLLPERFGRKRSYALGKMSGKANVLKNLEELGVTLNEEDLKKVTKKIIQLGDKKQKITTSDLPYIISDVLNSEDKKNDIKIHSYVLTHSKGLKPSTTISVDFYGEIIEENSSGDGQFDAFFNALNKIFKKKKMNLPKLIDYFVHIPPGSSSDAFCETIITWKNTSFEFTTRGFDTDQTVSAIKATEKMLNSIDVNI